MSATPASVSFLFGVASGVTGAGSGAPSASGAAGTVVGTVIGTEARRRVDGMRGGANLATIRAAAAARNYAATGQRPGASTGGAIHPHFAARRAEAKAAYAARQ